jgi:hypothetical protein
VILHLNFFASRAEFVALAILSPVVWLRLCCLVLLHLNFFVSCTEFVALTILSSAIRLRLGCLVGQDVFLRRMAIRLAGRHAIEEADSQSAAD